MIDPDELNELIQEAGLGSRTADKLRKAAEKLRNASSEQPTEAPGHGSAQETTKDFGGL